MGFLLSVILAWIFYLYKYNIYHLYIIDLLLFFKTCLSPTSQPNETLYSRYEYDLGVDPIFKLDLKYSNYKLLFKY